MLMEAFGEDLVCEMKRTNIVVDMRKLFRGVKRNISIIFQVKATVNPIPLLEAHD